ncbi:unnamed protein product [Cylindrotheca closterium]|uniref:Uncharacterized protein n=1 Tax=Cylindrotheca closterium TaxID=2856 RepID=A0AAD2G9D9_9STRA|nr:unnamed protein product [Cylindrotheca closterium]
MWSLSHAVTLNNQGVGLLLQHDHKGATTYFIDALSSVKQMLGGTQGGKRAVASNTPPALVHESTYNIPGFHDLNCFVFASAITLSPNVKVSDAESINDISAVILLNIALAYHHAGQVDRSLLTKAEHMYATASEIATMNNDRRHGTCLLVKAAATNNLAQIRHARGEYSHSLEGFNYLGSLFATFGQVIQRTRVEQDVYQGMLMNALLMTPPETAAAA